MNKYTLYFEIFGKKMKTEIIASNEYNARLLLKDKIIVHKVTSNPLSINDFFNGIFQK